MLRRVVVVTDVSGQPIILECLTLKDGTERLFRNVSNYQSRLRNIPEQQSTPESLRYIYEYYTTCSVTHISYNAQIIIVVFLK